MGAAAHHPHAGHSAGGLYYRPARRQQRHRSAYSSQVVLALQLPFAMFPLLHFTSSRKRMGNWKNGWFLLIAGWGSAILITAMDIYGLPDSLKAAWQVVTGG